MIQTWPLLSLLIWLPIVGGALVSLVRAATTARWLALAIAVLVFAFTARILSSTHLDI